MSELTSEQTFIMGKAFELMEGMKGSPRGNESATRRAVAFWKVLEIRKCANREAIEKASERYASEFDDFPTPRQFADIVQSCMGNKTHIVDPVYIADGGYAYVVERSFAQYHCYTIHAELHHAEKEAQTQTNVIFGNMTGGNKPKGNLGGFLD